MNFHKTCVKWINFQESIEEYQILNDQLHTFSQNFKNSEIQEMYHQHEKSTYVSLFRICTLLQIIINIILSINSYISFHLPGLAIIRSTFAFWLTFSLVWQSRSCQNNWINKINFFSVVNSFIQLSTCIYFYSTFVININNNSQISGVSLICGSMQILFAMSYLLVCPSWQCQVLIVVGYSTTMMVVSQEYKNAKQLYEYLLILLVCFVFRMKDKYTKLIFLQVHAQKQNNMACMKIFDECVPSSIIIVEMNDRLLSISTKAQNKNDYLIDNLQQPTQTHFQFQLLYANKFAQQYLNCSTGFDCVQQIEEIQVIQDSDKTQNLVDILKNLSWIDTIPSEVKNSHYALGQDQQVIPCSKVVVDTTKVIDEHPKKQYCDVTLRSCVWKGKKSVIIVLNDTTDRVTRLEYFTDLNNYKDQLLATVSHDLKTPLNSTQLLLFTMRELCEGKKSLGTNDILNLLQYICDICSNSNLLMTMINDLLDYSQMRKGKLRLASDYFLLDECLNTVHCIFKGQTQQKKLELSFEKLNFTGPLNLKTDQNRLKQILINLLSNSLKFTFEGSIKLKIFLKEPYLEFTVEDTGIGMPQCIVEKLFKQYATFNLGNKNKQGVGLGLVISSKLVGLLGPEEKIMVESEEGKGTRFSFQIFRKIKQSQESQLDFQQDDYQEIAQQPYLTQKSFKLMNSLLISSKLELQVMIVDDTIFNITALKIILQKVMKCSVTEIYNGQTAVKLIKSGKKYDLILMDISMPVMDGYQATKLIRKYEIEQQNRPCTIIMASAYTLEQEFQQIQENGANGLIEKPISIKILTEMLRKHKFIN